MELAVALGATAVLGRPTHARSKVAWQERRDLYPEGVASGDPESQSVLLWTRRPPTKGGKTVDKLTVEVAADESFTRVVAAAGALISATSDWTCRVLVGGLKPSGIYWYRFSEGEGRGSRIGRTITAPTDKDSRPVRFAFVSCQNANQGAQNAYRRMIFEDERAAEEDRLGFVLHLGDFIYEIVWYPENRPQGGHGHAVVRATSDALETEFVCIPRPLERSDRLDGGPLAYRCRHHVRLWRNGDAPKMETRIVEGDAPFSV
jgi:alkaline phosphatase D